MIILGVDVETAGKKDEDALPELLEVGLVLYDTVRDDIVNMMSRVIRVEVWSAEAEGVHKIPEAWSDAATRRCDPWEAIDGDRAELIVAHSAEYDAPIVKGAWPDFENVPWLCTYKDLDHKAILPRFSTTFRSGRLGHLAYDYGLSYTFVPHRALADAHMACLVASNHPLPERLRWKNADKFEVRALPGRAYSKAWADRMYKEGGYRYCGAGAREGVEEKCYWKGDVLAEEIAVEEAFIQSVTDGVWRTKTILLPPRLY